MLFSILIPVYNADRYLKQCLESIVAQTYRDFEVWMINDGSKDNSGEICNEYARKYPHMHVVHRENRGTIITRAELVSYAQGDYCLFVDSDDYIRKDALNIVKNVLLETNADCVVFGLERIMNGCSIGVTTEDAADSKNDWLGGASTGERISTLRCNNSSWKCWNENKL